MADLSNENPVPTMRYPLFRTIRLIFLMLLIVIILAGGAVYVYIQWTNHTLYFAKNIHTLQQVAKNHQESINRLQQAILSLQQTVQQSEAKVLKQAQVIQAIQGGQKNHLDIWRAAEADYLVRLANHQLQLTNNISIVITLLQRAEETLQPVEEAALLNIRQSIVEDIARIKKNPTPDITKLYQQLVALNDQVDQLPLTGIHTTKSVQDNSPTPVLPWWKNILHQSLVVLNKTQQNYHCASPRNK
jgi:uroporphyrin-3 C-methyltransferase